MNARLRRLAIALGLAGALLMCPAAIASAAAVVDGCGVTLTGPGVVSISGGPVDGSSDYTVDGSIELVLASGDYSAEWDDGTVDVFTLVCDDAAILIDPDYDPDATPAPDPTDEPPPTPEAAVDGERPARAIAVAVVAPGRHGHGWMTPS
jgi:hypothetical protein